MFELLENWNTYRHRSFKYLLKNLMYYLNIEIWLQKIQIISCRLNWHFMCYQNSYKYIKIIIFRVYFFFFFFFQKRDVQLAKTLTITLLVFIICWLPVMALFMADLIISENTPELSKSRWSFWIGFIFATSLFLEYFYLQK